MEFSNAVYLSQRISERDKLKNNKEWAKRMIDYIATQHLVNSYYETRNVDSSISVHNDYARMLSNYQLYNNVINQKDFERECNPLGLQVGQFKEEIKPYNKTYNKIQVLLGEELKRPFDYKVVTVNEDGIRQKLIEKDESIHSYLEQIVSTITQSYSQQMQAQVDPNLPEDQKAQAQQEAQQKMQEKIDRMLDPEYIDKAMSTTASQKREITWSKILKYLTTYQDILDKKNDAFKHALIAGEEIAWVGIENNEPVVKTINPLGFIKDKSKDTKWGQDGNFAGYITDMAIHEIIAVFGDDLEEEDLATLENRLKAFSKGSKLSTFYSDQRSQEAAMFGLPIRMDNIGAYGDMSSTTSSLNITHCEWKSLRKVYFLKYTNMYGETQVDMVDADTFAIPSYAKNRYETDMWGKRKKIITFDEMEIETKWIPDVWEGIRIGDNIYCRIGRKPYQFRSIDNPFNVKLGYHSVTYSNTNAPAISMLDRMKPFQYLYLLVMHRLKEMIAKDKGKTFHFDVSMIDPKIGLEKTLYYLDKLDIDFYNPLQNAEVAGAAQRAKITTATDRSNMQHIMNYVQLLEALDQQIADVAGVSKQREGGSSPYETATTNQNAIIQSSHITEIYFQTHSKLWEHVLNSLVQVAQSCWKNKGMKKQFILDDLSVQLLDVSPDEITGADMGVFVSNSRRDQEIFQKLENLSEFALSSGSANLSDMVALFKSNSISEMEVNLKALERRNQKNQQAQQQQQLEMQKQMEDAKIASEERKMQHEKELKQMDIEARLQEAEIKSFSFVEDQDSNGDNIPDQLQIEKIKSERQIKNRELDIREKEMAQEKELKTRELQIKNKQASKSNKGN